MTDTAPDHEHHQKDEVKINITNPTPNVAASPVGSYTPGMYNSGGAFGMSNNMLEGLLFGMLAGNGGLFGNRNGNDIGEKIATSTNALTAATQAQALASIEATNRGNSEQLRQFAQVAADINRINGDIRLSAAESENRIGSAIERNGGDTRLANAQSEARISDSVNRNANELHSTVEDRAAELRNTLAVNNATTLLEIERTKFGVVEAKCNLERQAADNYAAIQLEAEKNKYQITKQLEECCCELKERIHAEGETTRALIEKNLIDELRAKNVELANALGEAREQERRWRDKADEERRRSNDEHVTRIVNILSATATAGRAA